MVQKRGNTDTVGIYRLKRDYSDDEPPHMLLDRLPNEIITELTSNNEIIPQMIKNVKWAQRVIQSELRPEIYPRIF